MSVVHFKPLLSDPLEHLTISQDGKHIVAGSSGVNELIILGGLETTWVIKHTLTLSGPPTALVTSTVDDLCYVCVGIQDDGSCQTSGMWNRLIVYSLWVTAEDGATEVKELFHVNTTVCTGLVVAPNANAVFTLTQSKKHLKAWSLKSQVGITFLKFCNHRKLFFNY